MLQRHDLLEVSEGAWETMLAERADLHNIPIVASWAARRWPVIARRPAECDPFGALTLGLPLPPSQGKRRLTFVLTAEAHVVKRPPVLLCDAASFAPRPWRATIQDTLALGETLGRLPHVFGALLWQAVTGLPYITQHSDLDLLWEVTDLHDATLLVEELRRLEVASPVRLDGELLLENGAGVHWQEVARSLQEPDRGMLVKSMRGVEMRFLHELFPAPVPA